jgi:cell wall assembly regulator SMI1
MSISEMYRRIDLLTKKKCGEGATAQQIAEAELALGIRLPNSYKSFLLRFGWAEIDSDTLYGLGDDVAQGHTLVKNTFSERYHAHPHIPHHLVPVMNDGAGNNYCLDTSRPHGDECPVVFWDHEHHDGPDQLPEQVSPSFDRWLIDRIVDNPYTDDL